MPSGVCFAVGGFAYRSVGAYIRQMYRDQGLRPVRAAKKRPTTSDWQHPGWVPCPKAWYHKQYTVPLAERSVNW